MSSLMSALVTMYPRWLVHLRYRPALPHFRMQFYKVSQTFVEKRHSSSSKELSDALVAWAFLL